jgi:hypothetical protein
VPQFEFAYLDPRRDSFRHGVMGAIRRTINLIIALVLFAMGCGGLAYFYFIAGTRNAGTFATSSVLLLVTAYMFGAGLLSAITQTIAWCMRWPLPRQRARYSIRHAAALILAFCQFQCSIAPSAIPPPESERKRPARYGLALVPDRTFYGTRLATTEAFTVDSTT